MQNNLLSETRLKPADLARLAKFGISDVLIQAAGIRRVTDSEARNDCGIHFNVDLAGIAYPIMAPSGSTVGWRLRRDRPEMEDGKAKNKWVQSLDRAHLYFTPNTRQWITDVSVPVVFVEAYTSALAIDALGQRTGSRFCVVATGGCWGWRGQIGITPSEDGTRVPEKGPLADLDHIAFAERSSIICFDANVSTNVKVQGARDAFSKELRSREAKVSFATVPVEAGVNGPDDYLALHGDEALLKLLNNSVPLANQASSESTADRLVALATTVDVELFHQDVDEAYASVKVGGHVETWPVYSGGFKRWLSRAYFLEHGKAPTSNAMNDALNVIAARANYDGDQRTVHVRVAEIDGGLLLDLADEQWRAVKITREGWTIIRDVPVKFVRTRGTLPIPEPVNGGSLNELQDFVNIPDEESWALFKAFLVSGLRPNRPQPILILTGEQGSAKSSAARTCVALLDPRRAPVRSLPRDCRDLMIASANAWIMAYDNVSSVSPWLSDALCALSTGGGLTTRQLYSDADEKLFDAKRPIILNGITDIATRPDLLDRSILLTLPTIPDTRRLEEDDLQRRFAKAQPRILGALLNAAVLAIRNLDTLEMNEKPRMADFARWASAAEPSHSPETIFLRAYHANRQDVNSVALETSVIGPPLLTFIEDHSPWTGTVGELLETLNSRVEIHKRTKAWPETPRKLTAELKRLIPNLRRDQVEAAFGARNNKGRQLTLQKIPNRSSQPSQTTIVKTAQAVASDGLAEAPIPDRHTRADTDTKNSKNPFILNGTDDCDGCDGLTTGSINDPGEAVWKR